MTTAKYLLRAPEEDMARWRGDAGNRGVTFADWLRDAADFWMLQPFVRSPVKAAPVTDGGLGPGDGAASTGDGSSPDRDPPEIDPPVVSPVDLQEQARRLAERMRQR